MKSCFSYKKSLVRHCFRVISCSCSDLCRQVGTRAPFDHRSGRRVISFDGARNKYSITSCEHEKMKFFGCGFAAPCSLLCSNCGILFFEHQIACKLLICNYFFQVSRPIHGILRTLLHYLARKVLCSPWFFLITTTIPDPKSPVQYRRTAAASSWSGISSRSTANTSPPLP